MTLKKISFFIGFLLLPFVVSSQTDKSTPLIHSHNDYQRTMPFYEAYINGASSIEMDIFLHKDELFVAHDFRDIIPSHTFEELYIKPLLSLQQRGVFPKGKDITPLQYLFDIKSKASIQCLKKLKQVCSIYPEIFGNATQPSLIKIVVTGNIPATEKFGIFPKFIMFDGRPNINYTDAELERIAIISDNFRNYSHWNGKGRLIDRDLDTIMKTVSKVHALGKPIRFWATPDSKSTWEAFLQLGIDYVNTDNTKAVSMYYKHATKSRYSSVNGHKVIPPKRMTFEKAKNVILMIGDGMGLAQLSAGLLANKGELYMGKFPVYGFSMTQSADDFTTDSAAGGTAMATGVKTNNRYIGMDSNNRPLNSLTVLSHKNNMKTGIVTTDNLTGATPSSFYAHQLDRDMSRKIVNDFTNSNIDLFIGNGKKVLDSLFENGIDVINKKGFVPIVDRYDNLSELGNSKPVVLISNTNAKEKNGNPQLLSEMTSTAINILNKENVNGFFLMVESAKIDSGGHNNSVEQVVEEVLAFDKAIGQALKFAQEEGNTLVIITADHETGGMSLPQGNFATGMVQGMFHSKDHSGIAVPVMAFGPGAHLFSGIYQNIEIYNKILSVLEIEDTN